MKLTDSKKREYIKKIALSRLRILDNHGFYGLLLMHMSFGLDESCKTAYTDGYKLCFSPEFLESLKPSEVDFVLMHEIMHVVLKHCFRGAKYDPNIFNIACDIVVNSNILKSNNMNLSSISINGAELMHTINGHEGYEFTAEEVYEMLPKKGNVFGASHFDDHSHWAEITEDGGSEGVDEWEQRIINAVEALQIKNSSDKRGEIPLGALRKYDELKDSTVDWRTLFMDFISFEVSDYSFTPPDRRYDGPFFMPDFNEEEEVNKVKNILFEIDTSGSMSDKDITDAYSEIKGAIEYNNDHLQGWLGFYDAKAYDIKSFEDVDDILKIRPVGGGGTNCSVVFHNLNNFEAKIGGAPDAIVFLTDGYDNFPNEQVRKNIPVFWLINNKKNTPPWGVVARFGKGVSHHNK